MVTGISDWAPRLDIYLSQSKVEGLDVGLVMNSSEVQFEYFQEFSRRAVLVAFLSKN